MNYRAEIRRTLKRPGEPALAGFGRLAVWFTSGPCDIWKKPLSDGFLAVVLLNRGPSGDDASAAARNDLVEDLEINQEVSSQKDGVGVL